MVQYRFAKNTEGNTVTANDIADKPVQDKYYCLACDNELIAKVNGKKIKPHFAHKSKIECNGETYLHNLGKKVFAETYQNCLDNDLPFIIKLIFSKVCKKYRPLIMIECNLGFIEKEFDLTQYYQNILVEKRDGQFVPDILLYRTSNPNDKIYIEIAVTHFLSEEKENSGNRIIEIPIECEDDISKIKDAYLTHENALFLCFNQKSEAIADSECKCSIIKFFGFYVYASGKARLEYKPLSAIYEYVNKHQVQIIYSNIFRSAESKSNELHEFAESGGYHFREQLELAVERGINVKNCYLCKYHGSNWDYTTNHPIYCKAKKFKCSSNEAASCDWFREST